MLLKRLVTGELAFPSHAKSGVLLYGKYGTGKTTLAHLLAVLLEYQHAEAVDKKAYNWCYDYRGTQLSVTPEQTEAPCVAPASFTMINCGNHHSNSSTSVVQRIDEVSRHRLKYGCVAGSLNHFVLDELDCWSEAAQANLKGVITESPSWNVFYVTTNKRHAIDEGIISRCVSVEMNGTTPAISISSVSDRGRFRPHKFRLARSIGTSGTSGSGEGIADSSSFV
jgi:DNA polymerase III delta prime subunit